MAVPKGLRDPLDYASTRQRYFDSALDGIRSAYPVANDRYSLELEDVDYAGPSGFTPRQQKAAILQRKTLARPVKGHWVLKDLQTGEVVDRRRSTTIAEIPYMTDRGTFILGGNEYTVANQMRLKPGIYTRKRKSGELTSQFNVDKGGPGFSIDLEPASGVFKLRAGQAGIRLYPVLKQLGVDDRALKQAWGQLYDTNVGDDDPRSVAKAIAYFSRERARQGVGDAEKPDLKKIIEGLTLDAGVNTRTLGRPYANISSEAILDATKKIIALGRGDAREDNRDSLEFQELWGPEDFIAERFKKDSGQVAKRTLWKSTLRKSLKHIGPRHLQSQVESMFFGSGVAQPLEEVNLLDTLDQNLRVLRIGQGGMSAEAVPDSARNVQPSHFLFLDPIRSPESGSVGVDSRLAYRTYKGDDRRPYAMVLDRQGREAYINPEQLMDSVVGFPGEIERARKEGRKRVRAMVGGEIKYVLPSKLDYIAPDAESMLTPTMNLAPMVSAMKGGRALMAGKMMTQALPLEAGEAPLVQSRTPDGKSFTDEIGRYLGAHRSPKAGVVAAVSEDQIVVDNADGTQSVYDIYDNLPLNRKTYLTSKPVVRPGDAVKPGGLLSVSNMTDASGAVALGRNLRVAYLPYEALNYEDGAVISESAARKMSSLHMTTHGMDTDKLKYASKRQFMSVWPKKYTREQLDKVDDNGVVRPGAVLHKGDPIVLGVQRRTPKGAGMLYRGSKSAYEDVSEDWSHEYPGVVTDVWHDRDGMKAAVKSLVPMEVGDKLAGTYGDKGIVSKIIPDDQMPKDSAGNVMDIIVNPLGVISRVNPAQVAEAMLGKVAAATGRRYVVPGSTDDSIIEFAMRELDANGIPDTETVYDPRSGRNIENVMVGNKYYMKLHHVVEGKHTGRGTGGYTAEGTPARSVDGDDKPKRIGLGEMSGLISHGAVENIREIKTIKGQRNDEYWKAMTLGQTLPEPEVPQIYKKMMAAMRGSGIKIGRSGNYMHLTAMTDRDVESMSSGEIRSPEMVKWTESRERGALGEAQLDPVKDGLFDRGITGGHGGCFHPGVRIMTDHGELTIGEIVNRRLSVNVLSYDWTSRSFVYRPVVNWFINQAPYGIGHAEFRAACRTTRAHGWSGTQTLWGTPGHQVYTRDGSKTDLSEARELLAVEGRMTYEQEQILIGSMLGDGHIDKKGSYSEGHCARQAAYGQWKCHVFRGFNPRVYTNSRKQFKFRTAAHSVFKNARDLWYADMKRVPASVLNQIDALALSVWYQDDGSIIRCAGKNTWYIALSTHGFCREDVLALQAMLRTRFGVLSRVDRDDKKYAGRDIGWMLNIRQADKFLDIVAPYIHSSMRYKLGTRPVTKMCGCGAEIELTRDVCNLCLLQRAAGCGTHKLDKNVRRRLGGTASVRHLLDSGELPCEDAERARAWDYRNALCGIRVPDGPDTQPMILVPVPSEYIVGTGKVYESVKTVYDIEVEGTHNYFANGVLVSNSRWSHYTLSEPFVQPVMEEPVMRILGMTRPQYEAVVSGAADIPGVGSGGRAIKEALKRIKLGPEIENTEAAYRSSGSVTEKDRQLKRLKYLKTLADQGVNPADLVITKIPIVPPVFRPITANSKFSLVSDPNKLYKDIIESDQNLAALRTKMEGQPVNEARLQVYNAIKALSGLGDPVRPEHRSQGVRGLLTEIFGNQAKTGMFQYKLIGTPVDFAGRTTIIPNPDLDIDQVGIPEDEAWKLYAPFVTRKLIAGMGRDPEARARAVKMVADRDPRAKDVLLKEMSERPVLYSRAPALHRFSIMAAYPVLSSSKALEISPPITPGFNADFDGDEQFAKVLAIVPNEYFKLNQYKYLMSLWTPCTVDIMKTLNTRIPAYDTNTHTLIITDLEDFPRSELQHVKSGAAGVIEFYSVDPGIKVLAYDEKSGRPAWAKVSNWSRHPQRLIEVVNLDNGEQIITDDDPRAVYGVASDQTEPGLRRTTPSDAMARKFAVPYVVDIGSAMDADAPQVDVEFPGWPGGRMPLNWDTGYWLGVMAGDGWWSKKAHASLPDDSTLQWQWHIADLKGFNAAAVKRIINKYFGGDISWHVNAASKADHDDRYGDSVKHTAAGSMGAEICAFLSANLGGERSNTHSGSGSKRLPAWAFTASSDFRSGMLCGLIDTDGTASVSNGKSKPQLMVSFTSTSLRLCEDVKLLCRSMGIASTLSFSKKTDAGSESWILTLSTVDAKANGCLSRLQSPWKREAFIETPVSADSGAAVTRDLVPFPEYVASALLAEIGSERIPKDAATWTTRDRRMAESRAAVVVASKSRKRNLITRFTAGNLITALAAAQIEHIEDRLGAIKLLQAMEPDAGLTADVLDVLRRGVVAVATKWGDPVVYADGARHRVNINNWGRKGRYSGRGGSALLEWLESHGVQTCYDDAMVQQWLTIVEATGVRWTGIDSVEVTNQPEDGYDLTVPGYETFMSADGVILSNTMNFHVVVGDKAIEEVNEKLLPSRSLRSPADFGVMWAPRQEFLYGLYNATSRRNARRMLPAYDSMIDVIKAYKRGELNVDDVVTVKETR